MRAGWGFPQEWQELALRRAQYHTRPMIGEDTRMETNLVTTTNEFTGLKVTRYLGVVRGITVRSRSVIGQFGASVQQLFGGNISLYTELCEHARQEAFQLMMQHATEIGANAILGMRYDANEISDGVTEVISYGTAVVVERA